MPAPVGEADPSCADLLVMAGGGSVGDVCGWGDAAVRVDAGSVVRGKNATIFAVDVGGCGEQQPRRVVVKRVTAQHAANKSGAVRDAFVRSAEREVAFYEEVAADAPMAALWATARTAHRDAANGEYLLEMEDMYAAGFDQAPSLSAARVRSALEALAAFHARYWGGGRKGCGDGGAAEQEERGCFWPLHKRGAAETDPDAAGRHWEACREHYPDLLPAGLAERVARAAVEIDAAVAATCVTRVHGDCKGPNLFFADGREETGGELGSRVRFIDAQWVGPGNPFSDVAYLLTAGLEAALLPRFDEFFAYYEEQLRARLDAEQRREYEEVVRPTWDLCWLDYCRVVVLGLWKGLSPAKMERMAGEVGASMINRSQAHVAFIAARVDRKLAEKGW
eukprot:Rhum_TRINITY_DN12007_c0_g1::Rhum_TRINITY_DN12007_c0_g1_i1::g.48570::m.48570